MPDVVPDYTPGSDITCHFETACEGGRFVSISGPRVGGNIQVSRSGAAAAVFGVSARDRVIGDKGLVYASPSIVPVEVGAGAITAGDAIASDAAGRAVVAAAGEQIAGYACDDAAAGPATYVPVKLDANQAS